MKQPCAVHSKRLLNAAFPETKKYLIRTVCGVAHHAKVHGAGHDRRLHFGSWPFAKHRMATSYRCCFGCSDYWGLRVSDSRVYPGRDIRSARFETSSLDGVCGIQRFRAQLFQQPICALPYRFGSIRFATTLIFNGMSIISTEIRSNTAGQRLSPIGRIRVFISLWKRVFIHPLGGIRENLILMRVNDMNDAPPARRHILWPESLVQ